jgi:hypothetical protein
MCKKEEIRAKTREKKGTEQDERRERGERREKRE